MPINHSRILCVALSLLSTFSMATTEPQPLLGANPYTQMLPINTSGMTPGRLNSEAKAPLNTKLPMPLFIVGDDALSHRWLARHQSKLKQLKAVGMLVNVADEAALNRFKQYPLTIYPVRGDEFMQMFTLKHYPVLINSDGLLSQ